MLLYNTYLNLWGRGNAFQIREMFVGKIFEDYGQGWKGEGKKGEI